MKTISNLGSVKKIFQLAYRNNGKESDGGFDADLFSTLEKVYVQSVSHGQFGNFIYNMINIGTITTQIDGKSFNKLFSKVTIGAGIILNLNIKKGFLYQDVFKKQGFSDTKKYGVSFR